MNKSLLAICFAGVMIARSTFGGDQDISFSLEGWGRNIFVGEPLVLTGRVANAGSQEVELPLILDPSFGFARYWISYEEEPPRAFVPYLSFDGRAILQRLAPGQNHKGNIPLFCGADGYVFARPGKYRIVGEFQGAKSPPLLVTVRPPRGPLEACAAAAFSSHDVCRFILLKGGESFVSVPSLDVCRTDLLKNGGEFKSVPDFLERVLRSDSRFSSYARYALVEYYSSDGVVPGGIRSADRERVISLIGEKGLVDRSLPDYYRIRLFDRLIAAEAADKGKGEEARRHFQEFFDAFGQDDRAQVSLKRSAQLLGLEDSVLDPIEERKGIPFSAGGLLIENLSEGCSLASMVSSPSSGTIRGHRSKLKQVSSIALRKSVDPAVEGGKLVLRAKADVPPGVNLVAPSDGFVVLSAVISGIGTRVVHGLIKIDDRNLPAGFAVRPQEISVRLKLKVPCSQGEDFPWEKARLVPVVSHPGYTANIKLKLAAPDQWRTRIEDFEVEGDATLLPKRK